MKLFFLLVIVIVLVSITSRSTITRRSNGDQLTPQLVNVQINGVWHQFPKGDARDRGLRTGRQLRPALLLSQEAQLARATAACA